MLSGIMLIPKITIFFYFFVKIKAENINSIRILIVFTFFTCKFTKRRQLKDKSSKVPKLIIFT